jgi:hypothetical protein
VVDLVRDVVVDETAEARHIRSDAREDLEKAVVDF